MARELQEVYVIDACRTAFGKARPNGAFANTRADDMVVKVIRTLLERNPEVPKDKVDDNIWAASTQWGDQGLTMGRTTAILSGLPVTTPGCSVDRMCAGGATSASFGASEIQVGAADLIVAGGVEHMGHHPMGQGADPNPRFLAEKLVDQSALNMGMTAENLHDMFPDITQTQCDEYSILSQQKAKKALDEGKFDDIIVPMTVWSGDGWKVADKDEQPRPEATLESMNLQDRDRVLMVGDKTSTDILGAKNAGLRSALIRTGEFIQDGSADDLQPDYSFDSIAELGSFLFSGG